MLKKKLCNIISLVLVGGLLLTGCGKQQGADVKTNQEPKQKIVFASNRTDYVNSVFVDYVKEFNEKYPNIEVVVDVQKDYDQALKIKLSSNDVPDVWTMFVNTMPKQQFMEANIPLNDEEIFDKFDFTHAFEGTDGKCYGLVQGVALGGVLIYNKAIFRELGLEVPQTLDELKTVGKKITEAGKVGLATSAKAQWPLMGYEVYTPMYFSKNPDILNSVASVKNPFTLDSPFGKSYMLLKELADSGIFEEDPLSADWEPFKKDFRDGKIAMAFLDATVAPQLVSDKVPATDIGIAPFPFDNDKNNRYIVYKPETALGISKTSKAPEAAKAFFYFMMDDKYVDYAERNSLMSARKDKTTNVPFFQELEKFTYEKMDTVPKTEETNLIVSRGQVDFSAKLQEVLTGRDVKDILDDLNKAWTKGQQSQ